jgi:hypothetical protein
LRLPGHAAGRRDLVAVVADPDLALGGAEAFLAADRLAQNVEFADFRRRLYSIKSVPDVGTRQWAFALDQDRRSGCGSP